MVYTGDTVKFRISSPSGTWRTVNSMEEAELEVDLLINTYKMAWAAVDRIETTRVMVRHIKETS